MIDNPKVTWTAFAILAMFGTLKWVGTGQEELRLITGFLILSFFMLMCSLFLCVLAFVFVMLRCGWGQQRRS